MGRARVAGRRRSVIFFRGRAEEFGEDGLQRIGPDLVALEGGMQFVRIHHAVEEFAVAIREFVVDVEEADFIAIGELG